MFSTVTAIIPKRCQLVYDCLAGRMGQTDYTRATGKWRYIDLQRITGRSSSDKKLRELRDLNPGFIAEEPIPGAKKRGGDPPKHFWLAETSPTKQRVTKGTDGRLFDMPLGRPA